MQFSNVLSKYFIQYTTTCIFNSLLQSIIFFLEYLPTLMYKNRILGEDFVDGAILL